MTGKRKARRPRRWTWRGFVMAELENTPQGPRAYLSHRVWDLAECKRLVRWLNQHIAWLEADSKRKGGKGK